MGKYDQIMNAAEKRIKFTSYTKRPKKSKKQPLVYQYRNFQSFWEIIKSDCFWATNARFSNDEAEQQFGMDVISSLCEEIDGQDELIDLGLDDNYIICFCMENDKLSQWRGYAPEGGVSMGFEFGMSQVFSVLNSDIDGGRENAFDETNSVLQYVDINKVQYIDPHNDYDKNEYLEYCKECLRLVDPANNSDTKEVYRKEIQKKAPYIKHSGFEEEDECRLVFRNIDGQLDRCVRYRDASSEALKYPYIIVKVALPNDEKKLCVVRVCVNKDRETVIVKELGKLLEKKMGERIFVRGCHLTSESVFDTDEIFCEGCVLCHWKDTNHREKCRCKYNEGNKQYKCYLYESESCVVISQGKYQKEIYEEVYNYISNIGGVKIRVWCEGHLPLRKITVGPCVNQKSIAEAIRHYCKHTYWLRDVEIVLSTIPFRKSL